MQGAFKKDKTEQIEELILEIAHGDNDALGTLYELISTDIYAYALSKTVTPFDAEDILQSTFVQIYKNAHAYTPMGKPMAWIITIELNLIRRFFNQRSRITSIDQLPEQGVEDKALENSIKNELVRKIISLLSDEEREIVVLHVVWELKHREIATLLDKPLSTILSKYNRAIKRLQQKLEKEGKV